MPLRDDTPAVRFDWSRRFNAARQVARMSHSEVARRAGSHVAIVTAMSRGDKQGSPRVQGRIAEALGVPAFTLFPRDAREVALAADWLTAWESMLANDEAGGAGL